MSSRARGVVLDANILVRAVFGHQVVGMVQRYSRIAFYTPDLCFEEARTHIPRVCQRRGFDPRSFLSGLKDLRNRVSIVERRNYADREQEARERIPRDPDDWPIIATALALDLPIWTEDRDFFGCGVATWITNTVEIYLNN
jgi:predicted nucleic acid-binding protein